MGLQVDIVARSGELWKGQADSVSVPSFEGEIGILPQREPLLSVLRPGEVRIVADGKQQNFDIPRGFVVVDDDVVTIVIDDSDDDILDLEELEAN